MVRRIISQTDIDVIMLDKVHKPLHKLGPSTLILWTIIQIDHQGLSVSKAILDRFPPLNESINQTVAGHFGSHGVKKQFACLWHENTDWSDGGDWLKIVISGFGWDTTLATASKRANLDGRFGIHRDP